MRLSGTWRFPNTLGFITLACTGCLGAGSGTGPLASPLRTDAYIQQPIAPTLLEPAPPAPTLPDPPKAEAKQITNGALDLASVLNSVGQHFPLLFAIEQERSIAAGRRISAEGQFDPIARSRFINQNGTFASNVFDVNIEQPTPFWGISGIAGYRTGLSDFPDYNGGLLTADSGELRAGVTVPILRGGAIDSRRARLRAAQIEEQFADPTIRTARISYFRDAAIAYWSWVSAGAQYQIQLELLKFAQQRQVLFDAQLKEGAIAETPVELNRRLVANRKELAEAANRSLQANAVRLSLFLRDSNGNPQMPKAEQLPSQFINWKIPAPTAEQLQTDVELARQQRPELERFKLLRERFAVDLKLATNDLYPLINFFVNGSQDLGPSKKSSLDRQLAQVGATFEMPLPRRDALGRTRTAQSQMLQVLLQERDLRDNIQLQVQDAVSELETTYKRVELAREALDKAIRVLELETVNFENEQINLVQLNLQEIAAAEAQTVVVNNLAIYFIATARYIASLGIEIPLNGQGGNVLPSTTSSGVLPPREVRLPEPKQKKAPKKP
jgi:outer membrane protein, heavy metal efflux system